MHQHQQDFDTRPLTDGLHDLAGRAADAPGLFDAVAAGARRRSARVRVSGAALAVGGVLGVAAGVGAWPSSSTAPGVTADASVASPGRPYHCPAEPPVRGKSLGTPGPSDRLFTGAPTAATLCVYGVTDSGTVVRPERITGSDLKTLIRDLSAVESAQGPFCIETLRDPEHLLVMQYADGSPQSLVIDMSGCGTVSNGKWSVMLPAELRQRITP